MNKPLRDWEKDFCLFYVKSHVAKRAYEEARPGVKSSTAKVCGHKLLQRQDIKDEIKRLEDEIKASSILDITKRMEILSSIALTGKDAEKIKAIEALNKMEGIGNNNQTITVNSSPILDFKNFTKEELLNIVCSSDEEDDDDD